MRRPAFLLAMLVTLCALGAEARPKVGDMVGSNEPEPGSSGDARPADPPPEPEEPREERSRVGPYVALGGHYALENFTFDRHLETNDSAGLSARLGFRSHPRLSFELVFDWAAPFRVEQVGRRVGDIEMFFFSMNAKYFLTTGALRPFLSAGVGLLVVEQDLDFVDDTDTPAAGRFGGGLELRLSRSLGLAAEAVYVPVFDDPKDVDFALFGAQLQWHF